MATGESKDGNDARPVELEDAGELRRQGDELGRADVSAVERLCAENPDLRFLLTFLSRAKRHELCVSARKFPSLLPFGC